MVRQEICVFLYYYFLAVARALWDFSSPSRDQTPALDSASMRAWSPHQWTTREFPEKFKHKKFFLSGGLPSPLTVPCVPTLGIDQTSPIKRNTDSTINSNILPASRQLLNTPRPCKRPQWCLDLGCVNCQQYAIERTAICFRKYICVFWLPTGRTGFGTFWEAVTGL